MKIYHAIIMETTYFFHDYFLFFILIRKWSKIEQRKKIKIKCYNKVSEAKANEQHLAENMMEINERMIFCYIKSMK